METISIELPKVVSENLIDHIYSSLNMIFPKLFCRVDIEEKLLKITVPYIDTRTEPVSVIKTSDPSAENTCIYKVTLSPIDLVCNISYTVVDYNVEYISEYTKWKL